MTNYVNGSLTEIQETFLNIYGNIAAVPKNVIFGLISEKSYVMGDI